MVPEISVDDLARKLQGQDDFILLDVREAWELELAKIRDAHLLELPMSRLAQAGPAALPEAARSKEAEILVICHTGMRSSDVTRWLTAQGWKNVFSVRGGIDEYARKIDPEVGFY